MRISTNWIKDYVDLENVDLKELGERITKCGVNVEAVESSLDTSKLVVGQIVEHYPHPNSDHLNICKVNIGKEVLQIVCGAPNVKKDAKVIVSLVGAILPGDFEIKKSNIRGEESNGMLCALNELGLEDPHPEGIHLLPDNAVVGSNPFDYLEVSNDTVYTLDLNPNRNDCLSHIGFAYEVAAVENKKVTVPDLSYSESSKDVKENFKLKVETEDCPLMILKLIENITIKESPQFIKDRLASAGMRSINNVVDISNYVMLEYGQPLHYYDADKLGDTLGVRYAKDNESVVTLDNKTRVLSKDDLVITDGTSGVGVAGVMGGFDTEVTENTKRILIEAAVFNPISIRQTSIKLGLRSEASKRFEKPLNKDYCYEAVDRSCHLLEKYANAKPAKGIVVSDKFDKEPKKASVSLEKINKVMGIDLTKEDVKNAFDRLGFEFTGEFDVTIPNRRTDVAIPEDLIEEVGRLYGFEHIVGKHPVGVIKKGGYAPRIKYRKDISKRLRSLGLDEVRSYTLTSQDLANKFNYENADIISLSRPISKVKTQIRTSIIPSLIEINDYNKSRNLSDINIYEISSVYSGKDDKYDETLKLGILMTGEFMTNKWQGIRIKSDFYLLKGIIENLMHYLGLDKKVTYDKETIPSFMHPLCTARILVEGEVIGFLGRLHPNIDKKEVYVCEINIDKLFNKKIERISYCDPIKYPSIKRDIAFLFNKDIVVGEVLNTIKSLCDDTLKSIEVFDLFEVEDKLSIGFSLEYQNTEKTLTDEEISLYTEKIILEIIKKFNAILRDK